MNDKMQTVIALAFLIVVAYLCASVSVFAAAGDLDPTFGNGGKVIAIETGAFRDIAVQPDGKIVVVGGALILRYHGNGSLDGSFGAGGIVVIPAGPFEEISLTSIAIQSDGKIVAAAEIYSYVDPFSTCLLRLNPNGVWDTTFDGASTSFGGAASVAIQSDGKIVSCGWGGDSLVNRYHPNGGLDISFNGWGGVFTPDSTALSVAVQADGKILVAGIRHSVKSPFLIFRLNTDGSRDTSFGNNGTVTPPFVGHPRKLAIQPDGKIVAVGVAAELEIMVRFHSNGYLDTAFGNNGVVSALSVDVAIQADGKIVTVGSLNDDFGLARHNSNGTPDTTLGGDGIVSTSLGDLGAANAVAIQPDGNIVVAGYISDVPYDHGGLARFIGHTPTFSISGHVTAPSGQGLRNTTVVLTDPQGAIRTATTSSFGIYNFEGITVGQNYTVTVRSRRYRFTPRTLNISGSLTGVDLVGQE